MPKFKRCLHVKNDGTVCQAPAMRRRSCCYFHIDVRRRERRKQKARMECELRRQGEAQAAIALNLLRLRNLIDKQLLSKILRELCVEGECCE
ncbi:MAG TPA: hypothetical protein VKB58_09030 [Terriglobales bacterium]|nr:hypothetical protein [Terriglobales bacterium]